MYIETKTLPESLRNALSAAGIGRPTIRIEVSETYCQWSPSGQGQRSFTTAVNLATGETETAWGSWGGSNAFSPGNAVDNDTASRPLAPGFAIIHGTTGYKPSASIVIHPSNAAPLLPAKAELSERHQHLVNVFAGLNSQGRKNHFERNGNAPTEAELAELQAAGLITRNKAGSVTITAAGRNAKTNVTIY